MNQSADKDRFAIDTGRLTRTFIDLAKISSPSWSEHGVIDYTADRLKGAGAECRIIPCGASFNLYAKIKGTRHGTPILFSGHTDTVAPCDGVVPVISKSRISSDGNTILGGDNKAALAIFIEALEVIKEKRIPHPDIELLLSCAEELGLHGIKGFDLKLIEAKYVFVFDSDGAVGRIITGAPYHLKMDIFVKGKAAHAGMEPERGISAINTLAQIICSIPSGRIDHETTMNIGTISGGSATNIVAPSAECRLEIRSIDKGKAYSLAKKVSAAAKLSVASMGASVKIDQRLEYPGFRLRENDKIISIVKSAMGKIGVKPLTAVSGGGSDTNIFNSSGIKAINLSCGMRKVHTTDEYLLIKDLVNGARLVLALADSA